MGFRVPLLVLLLAAASCQVGQGVVEGPASVAAVRGATGPARAAGGEARVVEARGPLPEPHTGTLVPARHPDRRPCDPLEDGIAGAVCVEGFDGPMIVTDLEFGSDCPDELIVIAAAKVDRPQWYVVNPPHSRTSIHGAQLAVPTLFGLVFAARPPSGAQLTATSKCSVTWSATWRAGDRLE